MDSLNQEEQAVQHQELLMSQTRHPYLLPLVTQVVDPTILDVVVTEDPHHLVGGALHQVDMVLTVGNSMQAVLEAMGLEER